MATLPLFGARYRVLDRIGEGGAGEVFLCEQLEPVRRRVAIKRLRPGLNSAVLAERFLHEQAALALMEHPGIARLLDANRTVDGVPFFVLEYVPGVPLTTYCRERRLPLRSRLQLMIDVCAAVQHAHHKGVIHRDLKPTNILVMESDGSAQPRIIDFGISRSYLEGSTAAAGFSGSPQYMSPEQADGDPGTDTGSDIFSLGAVLHELITDEVPLPFDASKQTLSEYREMLRAIDPEAPSRRILLRDDSAHAARCGVTSARALAAAVRGELDWVVQKALAREPAARYATAAALAADLRNIIEHRPVSAARPTHWYALRKLAERHRAACAFGALAVITILVFSAWSGWQAWQLHGERDRARYHAAAAREVTDFLVNMLAADEGRTRGTRDLLIRETVDIGARRMQLELQQFPDARHPLQHAIARVYNALGRHDAAEEQLRQIIGDPGADSQRIREARLELARAHVARDQFDAAEAQLLAIRDDGVDRTALEARLELGRLYLERGRPDAEAEFAQVRDLALAQKQDDLRGLALLGLGNVLLEAGKIDEAGPPLDNAYALIEATLGPESDEGLDAREAIAYRLTLLGRYADALPLYRSILESARRIYGEQHHATALAWNDLGMVHMYLDDLEPSEIAWQNALAIHTAVHGENHSETLRVVSNLAGLYGKAGRMNDAAPLFERAVAARTKMFGADSEEVLRTQMNYGFARNVAGDFVAGEALMRGAYDGYRRRHGESHWLTLTTQAGVGEALLGQHRYVEAQKELCASYGALRETLGEMHPRTAFPRQLLEQLAREWTDGSGGCP